ncbi:hypothetical protein EON67_00885 [archaeon]|nr:MAG: hypothetical protein EON67_00885 [archaeon]
MAAAGRSTSRSARDGMLEPLAVEWVGEYNGHTAAVVSDAKARARGRWAAWLRVCVLYVCHITGTCADALCDARVACSGLGQGRVDAPRVGVCVRCV